MTYVTVKILLFIIIFCSCLCYPIFWCRPCILIVERVLTRTNDWGKYYRSRVLGGVEKAVE